MQNFNFCRYKYAHLPNPLWFVVAIEKKPAPGDHALSSLPSKKVGSGGEQLDPTYNKNDPVDPEFYN
jgi:hypothetical protein